MQMTVRTLIHKISDELGYNLLYAPDYPIEDKTSLDDEYQQIQMWIQEARKSSSSEMRLSIDHASVQINIAFDKFRIGRDSDARRYLEAAIEILH